MKRPGLIPAGRFLPATCLAALVAAAAWVNLPAFSPAHMEAYTMSLLGMAADLSRGGEEYMYAQDTSTPLVTAYLYLTRPGTVHALSWAGRVFGFEHAWPALMALSWVALIASCTAFARARGVPVWATALAVLLVQGISSAASLYNETLLWAALVAAAAASVPNRIAAGREWGIALPGILLAVAFFVRQDALAGGAVVGAAVLAAAASPRSAALSLLACAAGFLLCCTCLFGGFGISPAEGVRVAQIFTAGRVEAGVVWHPETILYAVGLPLLALAPLGFAAGGPRMHRWFLAAGVLIWVASLWMSSNPRYVLPALFPLLALWGGAGIVHLLGSLRSPRPFAAWTIAVAALALCFVNPPGPLNREDGPNALFGRFQAVHLWFGQQTNNLEAGAGIRAFVDGLPQGRTALVTAHYDDDAELRMEMSLRGWSVSWEGGDGTDGCFGGPIYRDGNGRELLHVRGQAFYNLNGQFWQHDAMFAASALSCPGLLEGTRVLVSSRMALPYYSHPRMWGESLSAWLRESPALRFRELSEEELSDMRRTLRAVAAGSVDRQGEPLSFERFWEAYRRR